MANTTAPRFLQFTIATPDHKVGVTYTMDNRRDERKCVTIYAKDYGQQLRRVLPEDIKVDNASDAMTDYFEHDSATIFEGHPLYAAVRERAESNKAKDEAKYLRKRCFSVRRQMDDRLKGREYTPEQRVVLLQRLCIEYHVDPVVYMEWLGNEPAAVPVPVAPEPETRTRFDYPAGFIQFLTVAMGRGVLDAVDVMALGATHGRNYMAAVNEVIEMAFAARHTHPEQHRALCPLADAIAAQAGTVPGAGGMSTVDTAKPLPEAYAKALAGSHVIMWAYDTEERRWKGGLLGRNDDGKVIATTQIDGFTWTVTADDVADPKQFRF